MGIKVMWATLAPHRVALPFTLIAAFGIFETRGNNMRTVFPILVYPCILFLFSGCDIVDPPFTDPGAVVSTDPIEGPARKVLLEEFTGHQCGHCPRGAYEAQQLKAIYGEQLIIYAAHATNLADNDISPYWYNFKCATGIEIADHFDPDGLPVGMVNRNKLNGSVTLGDNEWGSALATILANPAQISLDISSTYNSDTRELESTVKTEFVQAMNGTYNLCVFLVEDSIVKWQLIYSQYTNLGYPTGDVEDYVHRHALRGSMNNTWGDEIAAGAIATGDTVLSSYSTVLDTGWEENHMSVVAFVYDVATEEIIQAEEEHLH